MTDLELVLEIKKEVDGLYSIQTERLRKLVDELITRVPWSEDEIKKYTVDTPDFFNKRVDMFKKELCLYSETIKPEDLKIPDFLKNMEFERFKGQVIKKEDVKEPECLKNAITFKETVLKKEDIKEPECLKNAVILDKTVLTDGVEKPEQKKKSNYNTSLKVPDFLLESKARVDRLKAKGCVEEEIRKKYCGNLIKLEDEPQESEKDDKEPSYEKPVIVVNQELADKVANIRAKQAHVAENMAKEIDDVRLKYTRNGSNSSNKE